MNTRRYWVAFAVGVTAGASVALLYAPQTGVRARRRLRGGIGDASDYLEDTGDYLKSQAERLSQEAKATISRTKDHVEDAVDMVSDAANLAFETSEVISVRLFVFSGHETDRRSLKTARTSVQRQF